MHWQWNATLTTWPPKLLSFSLFFFKCILTNRHLLCSYNLKVIRCWSFQCALKAIGHVDASYMHILTCSKGTPTQMPAVQPLKCSYTFWQWKATFTTWLSKASYFSIFILNASSRTGSGKASSCTNRLYTHRCALKEITHADASYKHKPTCLKATPVHSFQLCAQPLKCSRTWWERWASLTTRLSKLSYFSLFTLNGFSQTAATYTACTI